jgi:hypothetical protein
MKRLSRYAASPAPPSPAGISNHIRSNVGLPISHLGAPDPTPSTHADLRSALPTPLANLGVKHGKPWSDFLNALWDRHRHERIERQAVNDCSSSLRSLLFCGGF